MSDDKKRDAAGPPLPSAVSTIAPESPAPPASPPPEGGFDDVAQQYEDERFSTRGIVGELKKAFLAGIQFLSRDLICEKLENSELKEKLEIREALLAEAKQQGRTEALIGAQNMIMKERRDIPPSVYEHLYALLEEYIKADRPTPSKGD